MEKTTNWSQFTSANHLWHLRSISTQSHTRTTGPCLAHATFGHCLPRRRRPQRAVGLWPTWRPLHRWCPHPASVDFGQETPDPDWIIPRKSGKPTNEPSHQPWLRGHTSEIYWACLLQKSHNHYPSSHDFLQSASHMINPIKSTVWSTLSHMIPLYHPIWLSNKYPILSRPPSIEHPLNGPKYVEIPC